MKNTVFIIAVKKDGQLKPEYEISIESWKKWCNKNHKSMSEVIESLMLRIMDEDRDLLSLTNEADDVRSKIQLSRYKIDRERTELDTLETELNLLEDRITVVQIEEKQDVKTALDRFKELKEK